jgi:hypothetical protein
MTLVNAQYRPAARPVGFVMFDTDKLVLAV